MKYKTGCQIRDAEGVSNEAFYKRAEEARLRARSFSISKALENPFTSVPVVLDIPLEFGPRWANRFLHRQHRLLESYRDNTSQLFGLVIRFFEYSKLKASTWVKEMLITSPLYGEIDPPDDLCLRSTPDEYIALEGWASTFNDSVFDINKPNELLIGSGFDVFPPDEDLLEAISIVWFFEASRLYKEKNPLFMDVLFEAEDAAESSYGLFMWKEGAENGGENPASVMAKRRHAENYALAGEAVKYWRENIDPGLSAAKAANDLVRVVPLSHKKLSEIISTAKKDIGKS